MCNFNHLNPFRLHWRKKLTYRRHAGPTWRHEISPAIPALISLVLGDWANFSFSAAFFRVFLHNIFHLFCSPVFAPLWSKWRVTGFRLIRMVSLFQIYTKSPLLCLQYSNCFFLPHLFFQCSSSSCIFFPISHYVAALLSSFSIFLLCKSCLLSFCLKQLWIFPHFVSLLSALSFALAASCLLASAWTLALYLCLFRVFLLGPLSQAWSDLSFLLRSIFTSKYETLFGGDIGCLGSDTMCPVRRPWPSPSFNQELLYMYIYYRNVTYLLIKWQEESKSLHPLEWFASVFCIFRYFWHYSFGVFYGEKVYLCPNQWEK